MFNVLLNAAIPPQQVTWNQPNITPTQAQSYGYTLQVTEESGRKTTYALSNTLCGTVNGNTQCSTALPANANVAIISNNQSILIATDKATGLQSFASLPFTGNQGCIFRDNLYPLNQRTTATANKNQLTNLLNEFKNAKFKQISITQKGNQFAVTEECVGFIVH